MGKAGVHIEDLPTETRNQIKKHLKPSRDTITRAAVAVLAALNQNDLDIKHWPRVLDLVRKWLKV